MKQRKQTENFRNLIQSSTVKNADSLPHIEQKCFSDGVLSISTSNPSSSFFIGPLHIHGRDARFIWCEIDDFVRKVFDFLDMGDQDDIIKLGLE